MICLVEDNGIAVQCGLLCVYLVSNSEIFQTHFLSIAKGAGL